MSDLDQICLVEKGHLQLAIPGQFLDLVGAEGGDPLDAVLSGQVLADACAGDHAAVADEYDIGERKSLTEFIDLGNDGFGIGGVAREYLDGDGATLGVGE